MKYRMTLKEADKYWDAMSPPEFKEGDIILIVPEQKVIDLSCVVGTRIPMLFGNHAKNITGYLKKLSVKHVDTININWKNCAFDTSPDAWVSWGKHVAGYDGKCPIPEGAVCSVIYREEGEQITCDLADASWQDSHSWQDSNDKWSIIAFRVTGLADGWKYAWEVEK